MLLSIFSNHSLAILPDPSPRKDSNLSCQPLRLFLFVFLQRAAECPFHSTLLCALRPLPPPTALRRLRGKTALPIAFTGDARKGREVFIVKNSCGTL
jgi:hypothetical protein